MADQLRSTGVDPVDLPKLKGNQNVRDTVKGTFAKETERNDPERVVETDDRRTPWKKEWDRLGEEMEHAATTTERGRYDCPICYEIDALTVSAIIHAQVLKRP